MNTRESSVTRRSKLLCPEGCGVKRVSDLSMEGLIVLECGHVRGELLPLKPGHVSIELLGSRRAKDQELAHRLFPASVESEPTAQLPGSILS